MFPAGQLLVLAMVLLLVFWSWIQLDLQRGAEPGPRVFLSHGGYVRGSWGTTPSGSRYQRFLGIPYALPPVGEKRFAPPERAASWVGEKQAKTEGPSCPQPRGALLEALIPRVSLLDRLLHLSRLLFEEMRDCLHQRALEQEREDCLFLNVHAPAPLPVPPFTCPRHRANLSAVLVWIHDGGFLLGERTTDDYDPGLLVDQGVVVVTLNYRQGVLGFLRAGPYTGAPGNVGLRDQALALEWVRDHIQGFGGDPARVTLWGSGAGAVSAHLHTMAPHCLFQQAILSSGVSLASWGMQLSPQKALADLVESLGRQSGGPNSPPQSDNPADVVRWLRAMPLSRLVPRSEAPPPSLSSQQWRPVVEDAPDEVYRFLSQDPLAVMRQGTFQTVPTMMGVNSREGLLWLVDKTNWKVHRMLRRIDSNFSSVLDDLPLLKTPLSMNQTRLAARLVRSYFFGRQRVDARSLAAFLDLYSDLMFNIAFLETAALHLQWSSHKLFLYRFSFNGRLSLLKSIIDSNVPGSAYANEIGYLFQDKLLPPEPLAEDSAETRTRHRLVQLWANFAKFGNPTPRGDTCDNLLWESTSAEISAYLDIDEDNIMMRRDMFADRAKFWKELYTNVLLTTVHW